jgi:hypothetical protein
MKGAIKRGNHNNQSPLDALNRLVILIDQLNAITAAIAPAGLATESTLLSVLSALQNGQEFEQQLVIDNNSDTYVQIRIWNTDTHSFEAPVYYNAAGVLSAPIPPLTLVNPQFVLDDMLIELQSINTTLATYSRNTGVATADTLRVVEATKDTAHTLVTDTAAGTVAAGYKSVTLANIGGANAIIDGNVIPAGVVITLPFNPSGSYTTAVNYDATGTTLLISTIV